MGGVGDRAHRRHGRLRPDGGRHRGLGAAPRGGRRSALPVGGRARVRRAGRHAPGRPRAGPRAAGRRLRQTPRSTWWSRSCRPVATPGRDRRPVTASGRLRRVDAGGCEGADARFRDVSGRSETAAVALVAVAGGHARVIARAEAPADPLSLARTRDAAAWESGRLVVRSLRRLARGGVLAPGEAPAAPCAAPSVAATVAHTARTAARGAASQDAQRAAAGGVVRRGAGALGGRACPRPAARAAEPARSLLSPTRSRSRSTAATTCSSRTTPMPPGAPSSRSARPGRTGSWSPPRTVLRRDHHLSYPCVFAHAGEIYMVPETADGGPDRAAPRRRVPRPVAARAGAGRRDRRGRCDDPRAGRRRVAVRERRRGPWRPRRAAPVLGARARRPLPPASGESGRHRPGQRPPGRAALPTRRRPHPARPGLLAPLRRRGRAEPGRRALAARVSRDGRRAHRAGLDARPRRHAHPARSTPGSSASTAPGQCPAGACGADATPRRAASGATGTRPPWSCRPAPSCRAASARGAAGAAAG